MRCSFRNPRPMTPPRCAMGDMPEAASRAQTTLEIGLAEIDRLTGNERLHNCRCRQCHRVSRATPVSSEPHVERQDLPAQKPRRIGYKPGLPNEAKSPQHFVIGREDDCIGGCHGSKPTTIHQPGKAHAVRAGHGHRSMKTEHVQVIPSGAEQLGGMKGNDRLAIGDELTPSLLAYKRRLRCGGASVDALTPTSRHASRGDLRTASLFAVRCMAPT